MNRLSGLAVVMAASLTGCQACTNESTIAAEHARDAVQTDDSRRGSQAPSTSITGSPNEPDSLSDSDLTNRVKSAADAQMMSMSPQPRDFTVSAVQGVVTLRGTVNSEADKSAIESAARAVVGVKRVESRLVVGIP
jgi:osmotically-inducible protein OsmY